MSYRITSQYCYYEYEVVIMYFINGIPFTFDELPAILQDHPEILSEADQNLQYSAEDLYKSSGYLIDECVHPCLFELDELENPEDIPR